jgi:hypothetical protein
VRGRSTADGGAPLRAGVVVFLAFVLAAVVTTGVVTAQKRSPSFIGDLRLTRRVVDPRTPGHRGTVQIGFRTKRADRARVSILSVSGRLVRTLGPPKPTLPYRRVSFAWRPVDRDGRPLAPGFYRVRIELLDSGRDLVLRGQAIRVARP